MKEGGRGGVGVARGRNDVGGAGIVWSRSG